MNTAQTTAPDQTDGLLLPGLDGTNPLGFLAALGVFRIVDSAQPLPSTRLLWRPSGGTWVPVLLGSDPNPDALIALLINALATDIAHHPIHLLDKLNQLSDSDPSSRRDFFIHHSLAASATNPNNTDWLAALASDVASSSAINQLQTARRDYFYGNLTSVISRSNPRHLRRAIFSPWDYADPLDNQSLHIDPSEDRRHAHQWNQPSGDPDKKSMGGMLGANRLAIEAFPIFTSLPRGDALQTVGFTGQRSYNTRWTWPIWTVPLSLSVLPSILGLAQLQTETLEARSRHELHLRGVEAVYRTSRILAGKTPNFTPAKRIA